MLNASATGSNADLSSSGSGVKGTSSIFIVLGRKNCLEEPYEKLEWEPSKSGRGVTIVDIGVVAWFLVISQGAMTSMTLFSDWTGIQWS